MNKKRLKKIIIILIIIGIVVLAYFIGWVETYFLAKKYFENALLKYEKGEIAEAIDGYEQYDEGKGEYVYWAGFVQISTMFDSRFCFPKPDISSKAWGFSLTAIAELGDEQLMSYFKKNMRQNSPIILYVCSELYHRMPDNSKYFLLLYEKLGGEYGKIDNYYQELHE